MENKILIIFSAVLFMIIFANTNLISATCNPSLQLINQDPLPAVPNDYLNLVFEVSGLTFDCLGNGFAVELVPSYPFSFDSNASAIQTLASTPSDGQSWTLSYKLRVAQDALEGDYDLKMLYHMGSSKDFTSAVVKNLNISIVNVQTDFAVVVQSTSGSQVSLGVVNVGKNAANSLIVGIPTQQNFRATGSSQQIVGNLAAGDYTITTFTISQSGIRNPNRTTVNASNSTILASQSLQVEIDYTDTIGVRRTVIKEVSFSSSSINSTFTGIQGGSFARSRSATISVWWYIGGGIIILLILIILFIKFKPKIKNHLKERQEKHSNKIPDWVSEERTHNKK